MRTSTIHRSTSETQIALTLTLDCTANSIARGLHGSSGQGFFDHMLNSFAIHSDSRIDLDMTGDLQVDSHHSVEDAGIALGKAYASALGEKAGVARFGTALIPMDEALARCVVDLSGRPYLVFNANFTSPSIGSYDTQLTREFFYALAMNMGATLHLNVEYGLNDHHTTEALFKAAAHAIRQAAGLTGGQILSAKGIL